MTKPHRVQLKRTKGWRMPEDTVKVDRATKWGNPFVVGERYPVIDEDGTLVRPAGQTEPLSPAAAVELFRDQMDRFPEFDDLTELRGKNLACWCPLDQPCHADVLLELANG